jgi:hypothetical protein
LVLRKPRRKVEAFRWSCAVTKAEKTGVINFVSAWLDHRVAGIEEEMKRLQKRLADAERRIEALDFFRNDAA